MNAELKNKVDQFKNSFSVEGIPLIKSNRFTQEEYEELIEQSGAHPSQFLHLSKTSKVFSDEEIGDQIQTLLETSKFSKDDLKNKFNKLFENLPYVNEEEEKELFIDEMYKILGWNNSTDSNLLVPMNEEFWKKVGSAPYFITDKDSNKKLVDLKRRFGAMGMKEIFGTKFDGSYEIRSVVFGFIYNFQTEWKQQQRLKIKKETIYSSEFNSLEEIEDNVVVKKIKIEAEKFYRDKTKDFKERCKVFGAHGGEESYIFHPTDRQLAKIFEIYCEGDNVERHSREETLYIIEWWVDYHLVEDRTHIDYSKNSYHPDIVTTTRNYTPSKEAIERLNRYYTEKLFLEGIAKFTFDW